MRGWIVIGMRVLLGLILLLTGTNKFGHFLPMPPLAEPAANLMEAFVATGYFLQLVGIVEIVCAAALLFGVFVPLALVVLAPISVNIVLFHLILDPGGIAGGALVAGLNLALGMVHWDRYRSMIGVL